VTGHNVLFYLLLNSRPQVRRGLAAPHETLNIGQNDKERRQPLHSPIWPLIFCAAKPLIEQGRGGVSKLLLIRSREDSELVHRHEGGVDRLERQQQRTQRIQQRQRSITSVPLRRSIILGVNQQRDASRLRSDQQTAPTCR